MLLPFDLWIVWFSIAIDMAIDMAIDIAACLNGKVQDVDALT